MNRKSVFRAGIFLAFFVGFSAFNANAQDVKMIKTDAAQFVEEDTTVYEIVMPEFPGGDKALMKFLIDSIVFPPSTRDISFQGKVIVEFIVEKDGSLSNFTVLRSPHSILSNEALRVVKLMPNWKPGTLQGKVVRVRYVLPVAFQLGDDSNKTAGQSKKSKKGKK